MGDLDHIPGMYYVIGKGTVLGKNGKPVEDSFRTMAGRDLDEVWKSIVGCHRDGCVVLAIERPDGSSMTEDDVLKELSERRKRDKGHQG